MAHGHCTSSSCRVYEPEAGCLHFAVWLFSTGPGRTCKEMVHALEWGVGFECAMACLGKRRLLALFRLRKPIYTIIQKSLHKRGRSHGFHSIMNLSKKQVVIAFSKNYSTYAYVMLQKKRRFPKKCAVFLRTSTNGYIKH